MKLLDQYVGRSVLQSTLTVMVVLLALFSFATFGGEMEDIGRGGYGSEEALQYTLLLLPGMAYQLFPLVMLMGSIIGLGMLASQSELVIMRAAGVTIKRLLWSVMRVGIALLLIMVIVGEFVAPKTELRAQTFKASLISGKAASFRSEEGLWARDGNSVIHIRDLISKERVANVFIYEFDEDNRLNKVTQAQRADFAGGQWHLGGVSSSVVSATGIKTTRLRESEWHSLLIPDLIDVVTIDSSSLSAVGLFQYIRYLRENGLDDSQYSLALLRKIMMPLTTLVMIYLSVPFVFGPLRTVGVGQRIFVGTLCGIGFFIVDQTTSQLGLVYGLSPLLSVLVAPLLFLSLAIVLIRRIF